MSKTMYVKEIMKTQLVTLNADVKLNFADDIMYLGRIRHLPVVNGKKIVGILTQRDLYRASLTSIVTNWNENRTFLDTVKIADIMTKDVKTISPDSTIEDAARIMIGDKIGCLPVTEADDNLVGLITETDVLQHFVNMSAKNK